MSDYIIAEIRADLAPGGPTLSVSSRRVLEQYLTTVAPSTNVGSKGAALSAEGQTEQRPPLPQCTCGHVDGHSGDCAVMKAHDAWVGRNDATILRRERELGSKALEVSPMQRRAFRYGYEVALAAAAQEVAPTVERDAGEEGK